MTAAGERQHSRGAVVLVMLGTFMVVLDTTIVNVALPQIGDDLGAGAGVEWVVTGYLLAMGVAQPATGWVGDRFGEKGAFLTMLGLFSASSILAAAAPTLATLVAARMLQGVFGGLAAPLSASLLFAMFPPERRGAVIGLSGTVVMVAPALGPAISGWVVTNASWRWLMLVNVPVGLAGVLFGLRMLPHIPARRERDFDAVGLALVAAGLVSLLLGITNANDWGWTSPAFLGLLALSAALLLFYGRRSHRVEHPLIDPRILADPVMRATLLIVWTVSLAQFGRMVFVPVELQTVRGMTAFQAGLVLALSAVVSAAFMPASGRWTDRSGGRRQVMIGITILAAASVRLGTLSLDTPEWQVIVAVAVTGLGMVLVTMPATVVSLNVVAARLGDHLVGEASAVRQLNRQIAGAVSTAILAAVVTASTGSLNATPTDAAGLADAQQAFNRVFLLGLVSLGVAFVFARKLPKRGVAAAEHDEEVLPVDGAG